MYVMYVCKHILCLHEYLCACVHACGVWGGRERVEGKPGKLEEDEIWEIL